MACAYIALGANLGSPVKSFKQALSLLNESERCWVTQVSSLYESAAFEATGPDYLNAVCEVMTTLRAPDLLTLMLGIEHQCGRVREFHHQPRLLDLDLLFFGNARIESKHLQLPHPRWSERAFVLLPLKELAPQRVSEDLLNKIKDQDIRSLGAWLDQS
jgi:2-amino-4-hydroxy-6-hydroxymethyldihydropteridine diphosphokinase